MHSAAVFVALLAIASASTIYRSPAHDSAVVRSDRVGGSFAYSVSENQAYGVVTPVVSHVTSPVATTYTVQQPSVVSTNVVSNAGVVNSVVPSYQGISTYAASVPYTSYVNGDNHPIVYSGNDGFEKQIDQVPQVAVQHVQVPQVHAVQQVQQVQVPQVHAVQQVQQVQVPQVQYSYATFQQPQVVQPQVQLLEQSQVIAHQPQVVAVQQPTQVISNVGALTPVTHSVGGINTVQQPQTQSVVTTVEQPAVHSVVSTGTPIATTYSVQHPNSILTSGSPTTYSYVPWNSAGNWAAQPNYVYGYGQPWAGNSNTVIV